MIPIPLDNPMRSPTATPLPVTPLPITLLAATLLTATSLLSGCTAHRSAVAADIIASQHLAGGWVPCHGAPGPCTARITLGPEEQDPDGICYEVVVKAPEEAEPLSLEVYTEGGTEPIASSGRGNPVAARLCVSGEDPPQPLELLVIVPQRVPEGASAAVFCE